MTQTQADGRYLPHGQFWFAQERGGYAIGSGDAEFAFVHADGKSDADMDKARVIAQQMAAAPEMAAALVDLRKQLREHIKLDVRKHYSLMLADVAASKALHKAGFPC